jgi:hypothetical protein
MRYSTDQGPGIDVMTGTALHRASAYVGDISVELDAVAAADGLVAEMAEAASTTATETGGDVTFMGAQKVGLLGTGSSAFVEACVELGVNSALAMVEVLQQLVRGEHVHIHDGGRVVVSAFSPIRPND